MSAERLLNFSVAAMWHVILVVLLLGNVIFWTTVLFRWIRQQPAVEEESLSKPSRYGVCAACRQYDDWRRDQHCIGGCGLTIAELEQRRVHLVDGWCCEPCQSEQRDSTEIIQARRRAVTRKGIQVSVDAHNARPHISR